MVEKYFAEVFGVECTGEMNWNCSRKLQCRWNLGKIGKIRENSENPGCFQWNTWVWNPTGASSEILQVDSSTQAGTSIARIVYVFMTLFPPSNDTDWWYHELGNLASV